MKKKIFYLVKNLDMGGTELHLVSIIPSLAKYFDIEVLTLAHKGLLASQLELKGIKVWTALSDKDLSFVEKFPHFIRVILTHLLRLKNLYLKFKKSPPDILHFYLPEAYIMGTLASLLSGFKGTRILSRRSLNAYQQRRPLAGWMERKLHRFTDKAVGNSLTVMKNLETEGFLKEKLYLIYNGLPIRQETVSSFSKDENKTVIVKVANLIPYKGHEDLLHALSQIKGDWKLILVGADSHGYESHLKKTANTLGIGDKISWLGRRDDVRKILESADIFVLSSHEEGFSNAILEAMSCSLPVIASDVGGNSEAVLHNETGIIFQARNREALAEALKTLLENKDLARHMGLKGRKRLESLFTHKRCIEGYMHLYGEMESAK